MAYSIFSGLANRMLTLFLKSGLLKPPNVHFCSSSSTSLGSWVYHSGPESILSLPRTVFSSVKHCLFGPKLDWANVCIRTNHKAAMEYCLCVCLSSPHNWHTSIVPIRRLRANRAQMNCWPVGHRITCNDRIAPVTTSSIISSSALVHILDSTWKRQQFVKSKAVSLSLPLDIFARHSLQTGLSLFRTFSSRFKDLLWPMWPFYIRILYIHHIKLVCFWQSGLPLITVFFTTL